MILLGINVEDTVQIRGINELRFDYAMVALNCKYGISLDEHGLPVFKNPVYRDNYITKLINQNQIYCTNSSAKPMVSWLEDIIFMCEDYRKDYNSVSSRTRPNTLYKDTSYSQPIEETIELLDYLDSYKVIDCKERKQ